MPFGENPKKFADAEDLQQRLGQMDPRLSGRNQATLAAADEDREYETQRYWQSLNRVPSEIPAGLAALRTRAYAELMGYTPEQYEAISPGLRYDLERGDEPEAVRQLRGAYNEQLRGAVAGDIIRRYTEGEISEQEAVDAINKLPGFDLELEDIRNHLAAMETMEEPMTAHEAELQEIERANRQHMLTITSRASEREAALYELLDEIQENYGDISAVRAVAEFIPRLSIVYDRIIAAKTGWRYGEGLLDKLRWAPTGFFAPGELFAQMRKDLRLASDDEVRDLVFHFKDIIERSVGIIGQNRLITREYLSDITAAGLRPRGEVDWNRLLWNSLILIDFNIIGRKVAQVARSRHYVGQAREAEKQFMANYKKAEADIKKALESPNPREAMIEAGFDPVFVNRVMVQMKPARADGTPIGATPEVPNILNVLRSEDVTQMVLARMNPFGSLTEAEIKAVRARIDAEYAGISGGRLRPEMSAFRFAEDGSTVSVTNMFGATARTGFLQFKQAQDFARKLISADPDAKVVIYERIRPALDSTNSKPVFRLVGHTEDPGRKVGRWRRNRPVIRPVGRRQTVEESKMRLRPVSDESPGARAIGGPSRPLGEGEFYVGFRETRRVDPVDRMIFGDDAPIINTLPGPRWFANILLPPESRISPSLFVKAMGRFLAGQNISSEVASLAKPLYNLPAGSRDRVWAALRQADLADAEARRLFDAEGLLSGAYGGPALTQREVTAFMSYRQMGDVLYTINNQRMREILAREGYGMYDIPATSSRPAFRNFGSERAGNAWLIPRKTEDGKRLRSPSDGKQLVNVSEGRPVSAVEARRLVNEEDYVVFRVREPIQQGDGVIYNYAIARRVDAQVSPLPRNVLKYEENYVPRIVDTDFSVVRVRTVTRDGEAGVKHEELVTLHGSAEEARTVAARMNAKASEKVTYRVVDRSVGRSTEQRALRDADILERPQYMFTTRDPHSQLTKAENLEYLADPFSSMQRAIHATSRAISWDDYMKAFDENFFTYYGRIFDEGEGKLIKNKYRAGRSGPEGAGARPADITAFLRTLKQNTSATDRAAMKQINEALDLWDYHNRLRGAVDQPNMAEWRRFVFGVANAADKMARAVGQPKAGEALSRRITTWQDTDMTALTRGVGFTFLLAANPTRQAFLQSSQWLFAASANPRLAKHSLQAGLALRAEGVRRMSRPGYKLTDEEASMFAKSAGMSVDDFRALREAWLTSGLREGIETYNYFAPGLYNWGLAQNASTWGRRTQQTANVIRAPHKAMKEIGFDFGEINNLSASFPMSAMRHADKTGKPLSRFTKQDWEWVTGDAARLALSMNRAGQPLYQQGVLGIFTQFYAIQQKALFAMIPTWMGGSRAWSAMEKRRLIAGQLALYGPHGVGIGYLTDDAFRTWANDHQGFLGDNPELEDFLTDLVTYGAFETMLNQILTALPTDEPGVKARISGIAQGFAPAGGAGQWFHENVIDMILDRQLDERILGATGSVMKKFRDSYKAAFVIQQIYNEGGIEGPAAVRHHVQNVMGIYGGFSNFTKAYYNMKIDRLIYGQYDLGDTVVAEEWARFVMGVRPRREAQVQALGSKLDDGAVPGTPGAQERLARDIIKAMDDIMFREGLGSLGDPESRMRKWELGAAQIRSALAMMDPADRRYVQGRIEDWIRTERKDAQDLAMNLIRRMDGGSLPATEQIRRRITGLEAIRQNPEFEAAYNELVRRLIEDVQMEHEFSREYYDSNNQNTLMDRARDFQQRIQQPGD